MVLTLFNYVEIFILIELALLYAIFDIFNNRNVPDQFAYFSVIVAAVAFLIAGQDYVYTIVLTLAVAAISYFLYRIGELGAGDGFEFVAISLLLPIQPQAAYLPSMNQLSLPFILSVFIATGIVTVFVVPIYYLLFVKLEKGVRVKKAKNGLIKGAAILLAYAVLLYMISYFTGFSWAKLVLVAIIAIPSAIIAVYEQDVMARMVQYIYPRKLEDGDIIAVNMMSRNDIAYFKNAAKDFDRLATNKLRREIKNKNRKLPVYKRAVPLAAFTFVAVLIALLWGNILLLLI